MSETKVRPSARDVARGFAEKHLDFVAGTSEIVAALARLIEQERGDSACPKCKELRHQLTIAQESNAQKNRALDAMHYVWCSGECEGGAHRYTKEAVTPEIVAAAIWNTTRLYEWFVNHAGRGDLPTGYRAEAWEHAREAIKSAAATAAESRCAELEREIANLEKSFDAMESRAIDSETKLAEAEAERDRLREACREALAVTDMLGVPINAKAVNILRSALQGRDEGGDAR